MWTILCVFEPVGEGLQFNDSGLALGTEGNDVPPPLDLAAESARNGPRFDHFLYQPHVTQKVKRLCYPRGLRDQVKTSARLSDPRTP